MPISEVYNEDCMVGMARYPDKFWELAVVDPEYGIGMDGGKIGVNGAAEAKNYVKKEWDNSPPQKVYFDELLRVSKNQIIWGANHFISNIPYDSSCWIVWDKNKVGGYYADCELAWTSFTSAVRLFKWTWHGFIQQDMKVKDIRIHPTQKPVALYKWLLSNYAKQGDKILDTHGGSFSSRIAAYDLGFDYWGWELDRDYYEAGNKRFEQFKSQLKLFQ